jgi:23S rRNA (uridine2552-2'-O)-methyltransferase
MNKKTNFQGGHRQKFTKVKTAKGRKASSTRWLQRQLNDPFVALSKKYNYRCRAAFKLLEIEENFKLVEKSKNIIDLGCAPGGWLQICQQIKEDINLIGIDLLEIEEMSNVKFILGDFLEEEKKQEIIDNLDGKKADLILSDIAPSTCGHKDTDHIRLLSIIEDIFEFCHQYLMDGGALVTKFFIGSGSDELIKNLKKSFSKVKTFKPESSRKQSKEIYLVCLDYNKNK